MSDDKKITAFVGQPVQITLQSMASSTGYSWFLTTLDGGLALSSSSAAPTGPGVAPINQTFDFLALKEGNFKVVFELIAPWRPGSPGDTTQYEIEIKKPLKSAADDIAEAMQGRDFVNAAAVNVGASATSSTVLKYAAPMAATSPAVLKYAAPMAQPTTLLAYAAPIAQPSTMMDYAAPMSYGGTLSADLAGRAALTTAAYAPQNIGGLWTYSPITMVAYAAPVMDWATRAMAAQPPVVVYAAPMSQAMGANAMMGNCPPVVVYAAPMSQAAALAPMSQTVILYAAPMTQNVQPLYAAPMSQSMQALYAAPMAQAGLLYAAPMPMIVRYAAPMALNTNMATMIQPYAAPFTGGGNCCC